MQHALNNQLDDTPEPETDPSRILLWMIRKWVSEHRQPKTFAARRTDADVDDLAPVMQGICRHAWRRVAVYPLCSSLISDDESRLLRAIALTQADEKVEAALVFSAFLDSPGVLAMRKPLRTLAKNLAARGHRLRLEAAPAPTGPDIAKPLAAKPRRIDVDSQPPVGRSRKNGL
ncbi:MAG: hypothetical protein ACE363_07120 [Alphaproteobacteria bacterium]